MERRTKLLKNVLLMLGIGACLTGCGEKSEHDDDHVIVDISGEIVIFRDCDNNYDISLNFYNHGGMEIMISKEGEDKIVQTIKCDDFTSYSGDDTYMLELEEKFIENGAHVYELKK